MTFNPLLLGAIQESGAGAAGMTVYGGLITQYTDSGTTYRCHTFRGSGKLTVVSNPAGATCDLLVVSGGGGGSSWDGSGGGGAGGAGTF